MTRPCSADTTLRLKIDLCFYIQSVLNPDVNLPWNVADTNQLLLVSLDKNCMKPKKTRSPHGPLWTFCGAFHLLKSETSLSSGRLKKMMLSYLLGFLIGINTRESKNISTNRHIFNVLAAIIGPAIKVVLILSPLTWQNDRFPNSSINELSPCDFVYKVVHF